MIRSAKTKQHVTSEVSTGKFSQMFIGHFLSYWCEHIRTIYVHSVWELDESSINNSVMQLKVEMLQTF